MEREKIIYKAALYCRLSSEDNQKGESSSIETQKMMLKTFCEQNGFLIYDIYIDDGYSGLNYDRPGFNRLLQDIEKGAVDLVITKDLSRLGRDYIQTGYYTDIFFRSKNIRYIAINDDVDTLNGNNDITPFKNILNDMYAKDISKKIKSAKRQRAYQGLFISARAPYGYMQDEDDGNHLVVDREVVDVVRLIFRLALEGNGGIKIAKELTKKKIPTPAEYSRRKGDSTFNRFIKEGNEDYMYTWKYATVRSILCNEMYMGDMVNRKYETIDYKTGKRTRIAENERIIVRDTHEAIVTRKDFKLVQKYMKSRHSKRKYNHENLFRGILFCSQCGKRLSFAMKPAGKGSHKAFYKCMNHYHNPKECILNNQVNYNYLRTFVKDYINKIFTNATTEDEFISYYFSISNTSNEIENFHFQKKEYDKRNDIIIELTRRMYEDYINSFISEDTYKKLLVQYQKEQQELSKELGVMNTNYDEDKILEKLRVVYRIIERYKNSEDMSLSRELINELIGKVIVSPVKIYQAKYFNDIEIVLIGFE